MITWTCHICHEERPDAAIGVRATDVSEEHGLPKGTMLQNVRYCVDRPACAAAAPSFRFTRKEED